MNAAIHHYVQIPSFVCFFVLVLIDFELTNTLFERLADKHTRYYDTIGRPSILRFVGLRRNLAADKWLFAAMFKEIPAAVSKDKGIVKLVRWNKRFAILTWLVWLIIAVSMIVGSR